MIGDTSSTLEERNVDDGNSEAADIARMWKDNQMLGKRNLSLPFDAVNDPKEIILKERLAVGEDDLLMESEQSSCPCLVDLCSSFSPCASRANGPQRTDCPLLANEIWAIYCTHATQRS